ncbi:MAG: hypothetical protein M3081_19915 [Gemmatimonadota bacterium]|nr:hypothetical protein [Gemmatimonadota bacterium]
MSLRTSRSLPARTWITRFALALAAAAQLCLIALAPAAEAREAKSAAAHVEAAGTTRHFAHQADNCAACVVRALVGDAPRAVRALPSLAMHERAVTRVVLPPQIAARASPISPRAPPAIV